jgi:hypothetical protein
VGLVLIIAYSALYESLWWAGVWWAGGLGAEYGSTRVCGGQLGGLVLRALGEGGGGAPGEAGRLATGAGRCAARSRSGAVPALRRAQQERSGAGAAWGRGDFRVPHPYRSKSRGAPSSLPNVRCAGTAWCAGVQVGAARLARLVCGVVWWRAAWGGAPGRRLPPPGAWRERDQEPLQLPGEREGQGGTGSISQAVNQLPPPSARIPPGLSGHHCLPPPPGSCPHASTRHDIVPPPALHPT